MEKIDKKLTLLGDHLLIIGRKISDCESSIDVHFVVSHFYLGTVQEGDKQN